MGCAASSETFNESANNNGPVTVVIAPKKENNNGAVNYPPVSDISSLESKQTSFNSSSLKSNISKYPENEAATLEINTVVAPTKSQINGSIDKDDIVRKISAISKIQRQARRKNALKAAHSEQQWKMFADLDVQDEAEMLHLAVFMQTLIDLIPAARTTSTQFDELLNDSSVKSDNEVSKPLTTLDGVLVGSSGSSKGGFLLSAEHTDSDTDDEQNVEGIKLHEVVLVTGPSMRKRSSSNLDFNQEYTITSPDITTGMTNQKF